MTWRAFGCVRACAQAGEGAGVAAAEASLWKALAGLEASLAPPLCWFHEDTCLFCTVGKMTHNMVVFFSGDRLANEKI